MYFIFQHFVTQYFQMNESGGGNSFFTQQKVAFSNLAVNVREMENSKSRK